MPHSKGMRLRVNGIVQGVGFRPFIWRLATDLKLTGRVYNDAGGVIIELNCNEAQAGEFAEMMSQQLPPLARIDAIHQEALDLPVFSSFAIDVNFNRALWHNAFYNLGYLDDHSDKNSRYFLHPNIFDFFYRR